MHITRLDERSWRGLGFLLDWSHLPDFTDTSADWDVAFQSMQALEAGSLANPDEQRQVGHYWLRSPDLAPAEFQQPIRDTLNICRKLATTLHKERRYRQLLVLGIGGSALGPQWIADALCEPEDPMRVHFLDNTDPDGFARVIGPLDLEETLVVCISKSGGTAETRNALLEVQAAFQENGVDFAANAIAISQEGSKLWQAAEGWRARLPMWDWVGGRTSLCSAVGLLPMFLQGIDADAFLEGAAAMDALTRLPDLSRNPAAILARIWYQLGEGRGRRAMVVLPYRDRLLLLSRYLQQLIMESIGKEMDLQGNLVYQGLTVYGNKGSTDQHAYVQQLRDGPDDHFVQLIGVQDDGYRSVEVEPGVDAADYLQGFLHGTRQALAQRHPVFTLMLPTVDAHHLGALVALYERTVGLYAARIGINAYHQPGVEAGKKAASQVLSWKKQLLAALDEEFRSVEELCNRAGCPDMVTAWHLLSRLAANDRIRVQLGECPSQDRFCS